MDIRNMIRNVLTSKIDEIDLEELTEEAIADCIEDYTGNFEVYVEQKIKEHIENNEDYETMTDQAISELIDENMH